jgi:thiosulfate/3-mercaptopyruvate sulfurtransferase
MSVAPDPDESLRQYAHPERLVTSEWVTAHRGDPGLVVVEADEDALVYDNGHIPGAVRMDWKTELNDPVVRDYLTGEGFAALCSSKGIARDDTVVFYGDNFNWWAAFALWIFSLFGHQDARLLLGGRQRWVVEHRDITREPTTRAHTEYPVVERDDASIRAFRDEVLPHVAAGCPLIDVRSPGEYSGAMVTWPGSPEEGGAVRGGHIPGAVHLPWRGAVNDDGTFKPVDDLAATYRDGWSLQPDDDVIIYCRIGERSAHSWFVMTHLLGYEHVRNYDGAWFEWGNLVGVPVMTGHEPGGPATGWAASSGRA